MVDAAFIARLQAMGFGFTWRIRSDAHVAAGEADYVALNDREIGWLCLNNRPRA